MGVAMWGNSRLKHQRVLLLAVAFVLIQTYVLYSSTFHVFHDMMPMCPICVAMKSYQGSLVDNPVSYIDLLKFFVEEITLTSQIPLVFPSVYLSRAPPAVN